MSQRQVRTVLRATHLVAAASSAFLIYAAPVVAADIARTLLALLLVPVLALSGLAMWQQARLRRFMGGARPESDRH